uniref:NADH dehydrogenase subunit 4L n=1 Tax=Amaga expatria TaxID=2744267 RepID=A0A899L728_9PLAT|nr:NADH dehydrogenase subunit 4L [Amaga expatria]QSM34667.1 NADH dehydrogenase subunit 4L [Amaga expatria]
MFYLNYLDFFLSLLFIFFLILFNLYSFRLLKFLIVAEIIMIIIFILVNLLTIKYEICFSLVYLSIASCEASIGLAILVNMVHFEDKNNVKGGIFVNF